MNEMEAAKEKVLDLAKEWFHAKTHEESKRAKLRLLEAVGNLTHLENQK